MDFFSFTPRIPVSPPMNAVLVFVTTAHVLFAAGWNEVQESLPTLMVEIPSFGWFCRVCCLHKVMTPLWLFFAFTHVRVHFFFYCGVFSQELALLSCWTATPVCTLCDSALLVFWSATTCVHW